MLVTCSLMYSLCINNKDDDDDDDVNDDLMMID